MTLILHGVELTTRVAAEGLFLANVEPLALTDDEVLTAINRSLGQYGCDEDVCAAEVWGEIADHPDCGYGRWNRCVARAARLVGSEA